MGERFASLPFTPVSLDPQGSKLNRDEYAELRDRATQIELNKLLNSKQFAKWSKKKHLAERRKLEYALGGLGLLITLSCLLVPWLWSAAIPPTSYPSASPLESASQTREQEEYLQAAKAAEVLAAELQATEDRINRQQEEYAAMQHTLWEAEEQLKAMQREHVLQLEMVTNGLTDDTTLGWSPGDTKAQAWLRRHGQYVAPAGAATALACLLGALAVRVRSRRRIAAALREAQALQAKIQEATAAQVAAEEQVCSIRVAMEGKVAELRRVATGKHQAEEQIVDLQRRILELNRPESAGKDWDDEQVREDMEAMSEEIQHLNEQVANRDEDLLNLNQELGELTDRLPREIQSREEAVKQLRVWLDQAQGELQETQSALNTKEQECRKLKEQLEDKMYHDSALKAAKTALDAALQREEDLKKECKLVKGEAAARVASAFDLLKSQRLFVSQRLNNVQSSSSKLSAITGGMSAGNSATSKGTQRAKKEPLRESGEFEGFVRNPTSTGKGQPSARGENADPNPHSQRSPSSPMKPTMLHFPKAAPSSSDSAASKPFEIQRPQLPRSPYWFAKGS